MVVMVETAPGEADAIEVATFRADGNYSDNRRPDEVVYSTDAATDVTRRDFTMNGLLMSPDGLVVDHVGGQADIKARLIRCIGDPAERFTEDALRMIRAVRFAAQLDFTIDKSTFCAIQDKAPTIVNVSRERVRDELIRILTSGNPVNGIALLFASGLGAYIFGEAFVERLPLAFTLEKFATFLPTDPVEALAMLVSDFPIDSSTRRFITDYIKDLKLSSDEASTIQGGLYLRFEFGLCTKEDSHHVRLKKIARKKGSDLAMKLLSQDAVLGRSIQSSLTCGAVLDMAGVFAALEPEAIFPEPLVTGHDLIEMGYKPSPKFAIVLDKVDTMQLGGMKDRDEAIAVARHTMETC
jgi:poly(A) polymerase